MADMDSVTGVITLICKEFIVKVVIALVVLLVEENILTSSSWHLIFHPIWHLLSSICAADIM